MPTFNERLNHLNAAKLRRFVNAARAYLKTSQYGHRGLFLLANG